MTDPMKSGLDSVSNLAAQDNEPFDLEAISFRIAGELAARAADGMSLGADGCIGWITRELTIVQSHARIAALNEAIKVAEDQDRAGREWVRDSLWDKIIRRVPDAIRELRDRTA